MIEEYFFFLLYIRGCFFSSFFKNAIRVVVTIRMKYLRFIYIHTHTCAMIKIAVQTHLCVLCVSVFTQGLGSACGEKWKKIDNAQPFHFPCTIRLVLRATTRIAIKEASKQVEGIISKKYACVCVGFFAFRSKKKRNFSFLKW